MKFQLSNRKRRGTLPFLSIATLLLVLSCNSDEQAADNSNTGDSVTQEIGKLLPNAEGIPGYQASGSPKVYTRQNVWDYLSQEAEIFLTNGFAQMAVANYRGSGDDSLIVEIAQFGEKRNAYALYSRSLDAAATSVDLEPNCYIAGRILYYTKGKYYLRIRGTSETMDDNLIAAAKQVSSGLEGDAFVHPHAKFLPTEGMIPNSIRISVMDNLQHNEHPDFVSALYVVNADTMRVHLQYYSRLGMTFAVEEFLDESGQVDEYLMGGKYQSLVGKSPNFGKIYCAVDGNTVCGVTGFSKLENAKAMATRVLEGIKANQ